MSSNKPFQFYFPIFLICFSVGLLYVYVIGPERKAIIKYPTPFNAKSLVYHDKLSKDECYMYTTDQVDCPSDPKKITKQPTV